MNLAVNSIMTLENNLRYVLLNETEYLGKKYFLAMEIDDKKEVIPSNVAIFEEIKDLFNIYVEKVNDSELIVTLTKLLKAQL